MKRTAGFTLMELLVAAAILTFALVGLLGVFAANLGLIDAGKNLTIATNHARCIMEEIRDRNIPSIITTENWTSWAQTPLASGGGGCNSLNNENIQVTYPAGQGVDPLEVVVTVNWSEKGRPRNVQLVTLVAER